MLATARGWEVWKQTKMSLRELLPGRQARSGMTQLGRLLEEIKPLRVYAPAS